MAVEELQSIIMRCQILEEQDFKEEDFGLFQLAGQRCIDEGHIEQLLEIIQNEKNKVIIKNMGWNLVGPVVRCLLWNKEDEKRKYYFLMLDLLVKLCNPKELLLGLLELIEEPSGKQISQIILLLLQPLQTVIQKLRNNKAYSVGLALSTLWSQLSLLPVPYSEEQIQTDDYGLCQCCKALIEFTKPFVEEVINDKENSLENENEKLKDELLKFGPAHFKLMRKKSLAMLQLYINKLDSQGKYTLFRCLLNTSNHSGVEAFIIQNIKNQIDLSLKGTHNNKWFTGPQLISLLDLVLFLPEGAETDLLQNSDRIMASLNLLRYLVIKDNEKDNQTGLWTELGRIENNFLKPLHTGLNMSKAHYEAEIKNSQENKVQKSKDLCSVTVGGEEIPNMPPEMQLKVLHSALFTFDLIESVLARVEELIEIKTKSAPEENIGIK
uniref:Glomulin, FKBP associated protein n=1 Tax=Ursus americanus TaxID=9643 RepID=A0A452R671_URSAM